MLSLSQYYESSQSNLRFAFSFMISQFKIITHERIRVLDLSSISFLHKSLPTILNSFSQTSVIFQSWVYLGFSGPALFPTLSPNYNAIELRHSN